MIAQDGGRDGSSAMLYGPSNEPSADRSARAGTGGSNSPVERRDGDGSAGPRVTITGPTFETSGEVLTPHGLNE